MSVMVLAYLGGVLTIVSPCILPVLPFVFAGAGRPFLRRGLPLLVGMAATFALVATLAAVGGGWVVRANLYARDAAVALFALFGLALLLPRVAERAMNPLVALGSRLSQSAEREGRAGGVIGSLLLGVATGLLWAPCAGPILGLILTGAALRGASLQTGLLLLAFGLGAATSLALALLAGGSVLAAMKRMLGVGEWIRRALGVAVLAAAAAIALQLDTGVLANASFASATSVEQALVDRLDPGAVAGVGVEQAVAQGLPVEGEMPSLSGAVAWLNSPPLSAADLRGKVVLVDFWTYSCINCLRSLPHIRAWAQKYKADGLVVIGVHTPEFAFERDIANVKGAVARLKLDFPIAIDNDYAIWRAFGNEYWPADYFIDAEGRIRGRQFGEGDYAKSEAIIRRLLAAAGHEPPQSDALVSGATGAEAAPDIADDESPETYIGFARSSGFVSPGGAIPDAPHAYAPDSPALNQWGLSGTWTIGSHEAELDSPQGGIEYRFHARDLHLVLAPGADGKPAPFRITIDGKPPGVDHGADDDAAGDGTVTGDRLYQLVRQRQPIVDRTFAIHFLDPGVRAYAFTFG